MGKRKMMEAWHDENLAITKHGLTQMRALIIIGTILGFALGMQTMYLILL